MRAFIVLCLVAVACAESGYNYGTGVGGSFGSASSSGPSFAGGAGIGGGSFGSGIGGGSFGSGIGGLNFGSGIGGGNFGSASNVAPSAGGELEKEFYTFTANDDDFNDGAASNQHANVAKQNLRVIFIKGPENNGLENAVLGLAKQASEQRTAIYVLNKQPDLSGLADKLNHANNNVNNKPEVHFVKYRTAEDAANAQRAIQGQYDSLGGRSQNFNGGVAPVLNFASQAPAGGHGSYGHGSHGGSAGPSSTYLAPGSGALSANYLPASILRRFRH